MLPIDNEVRNQILESEGNIIISASAGTGKTYTTVMRIKLDVSKITNYQTYAAVTFTRKAAREIRERLGPNVGEGYIGTNDNFVLKEIIEPFMYDVYGSEYKKEIKPDFTTQNAIVGFQAGINKIKDSGFICKYRNNKKNFSFQLALDILKNSLAARRYLKSRYFRFYIDEYQDCDVDMHNLFIFICESLQIPLFVVGDIKQSIYGWRGAYSDGFKGLMQNSNFSCFNLWHNFRSNSSIQNYSNIFMEDVRKNIDPKINFNNEIYSYRFQNESDATTFVTSWIDSSQNCSFLHFRRDSAEKWSGLLNNSGYDFVYIPASPLDNSDLESEHVWISRLLALYLLEDRFNEYDVFEEIPLPDSYDFKKIRSMLASILINLNTEEDFRNECLGFYEYLGYPNNDSSVIKEIDTLYFVVCNDKFKPTYNEKKYKFTSGTIHSSKGLEYDQVIIIANDYNLAIENDRYLHYVAVSRPKSRLLILIYDDNRGLEYMQELKRAITDTNTILSSNLSVSDIVKMRKVNGI